MLDRATFATIIEDAPLVSIDLIVTDSGGQLLVGKRVNEPAKDAWFVPGGRIKKDETLPDALNRIASAELELSNITWEDKNVAGVFTHLYDTNALGIPDVTTHYVVIGYRLDAPHGFDIEKLPTASETKQSGFQPDRPRPQHSKFAWVKDPADADAFRWLFAYSPYHRIRPKTKYPAVLVFTADSDDRCLNKALIRP